MYRILDTSTFHMNIFSRPATRTNACTFPPFKNGGDCSRCQCVRNKTRNVNMGTIAKPELSDRNLAERRRLDVRWGEVQSEARDDVVAYRSACRSRALDYLNDHDTTVVADDHGDAAQPFRGHTLLGARSAGRRERLRGRESSGTATALVASASDCKWGKVNLSIDNEATSFVSAYF